jgi:hypothetical protein
VINTGASEGAARKERIAILTQKVRVEGYWAAGAGLTLFQGYVPDRQARNATAFAGWHQANSRHPVGVWIKAGFNGRKVRMDIGGYHNQGLGAGTRASEVISAAIDANVHLLIGDFNTEPAAASLPPTTMTTTPRSSGSADGRPPGGPVAAGTGNPHSFR